VFDAVEADSDGLTFWRHYQDQSILCSFNLSPRPRPAPLMPNGQTLAGCADGGTIAPFSYWIVEAAS
jgi:hypothetical protein